MPSKDPLPQKYTPVGHIEKNFVILENLLSCFHYNMLFSAHFHVILRLIIHIEKYSTAMPKKSQIFGYNEHVFLYIYNSYHYVLSPLDIFL